MKGKILMAVLGVGLFVTLIMSFMFVGYTTVEGDERVVVQNWNSGVLDTILTDGTHFYIPLTTTHYKYKIGTDNFIMGNSEKYTGKGSNFADFPEFEVTCGGSGKEQPAKFSVTLQYHLDAKKLINLHKTAQNEYKDLVIKPALTRIISDLSTTKTVLDFYSGTGRVSLQKAIEKAITEHPKLSEAGIIVDTFVIDDIDLDPEYVAEITGRQIALQRELREKAEAKAAEQTAIKKEKLAEADKLTRIVAAEAKKQEQIKAAEAEAAKIELDAKANATRVKEAAAADRFRKEQDAKGALALGLAQAKVAKEKKMSKYEGEAGLRQAQVEMTMHRVEMFKNMNLKGIVPEKTVLTIIQDQVGRGVEKVLNVK